MTDREDTLTLANQSDQVTMQAASWVSQLDGGRLSDADRLALQEWSARSPRHLHELRRLAAVWEGLDETINTVLNFAPEPSTQTLRSVFVCWVQSRSSSRGGIFYTSTAALACVFLACCVWLFTYEQFTPIHQIYRTDVGEHKEFVLGDGSTATLNTNSILEFTLDKEKRSILLHQGEALFEVQHDPSKPFLVHAQGVVVEAIGTAFLVQVSGREVDVTVTEGIVAFSTDSHVSDKSKAQSTNKIDSLLVEAGYSVSSTSNDIETPKAQKISDTDVRQRTAWRDGLLIFNQDPLTKVVAEVGRYLPQTVVISDPSLGSLEFSGIFQSGDLHTLLSTLETSFNIERREVQPGIIHLSKK